MQDAGNATALTLNSSQPEVIVAKTSVEAAPQQALQLYERNWRHVDRAALTEAEAALIDTLSREIGGGRLLV